MLVPDTSAPCVYDLDVGKDPDDTCVAAMIARAPQRFRPALALTNDETAGLGRARFLSDMLGPDRAVVAAGLPSPRRVPDCLVERAGLVETAASEVHTDGVDRLLAVLEGSPRTRYFCLGALTNLAAALARRPDLAPRVDLVQMGPALASAYHRASPQYNARLDPASFSAVLRAVPPPSLLLAHVSWARYTEAADARLQLGIYPDDPVGRELGRAEHPALRRFHRHVLAWVESGFACSIMHDPLTVLGGMGDGPVEWEEGDLWVGDDGFADRTPLSGPGAMIRARLSRSADYGAARCAIAGALFDASLTEAAALARAWSEHNAARAER
jgi:Inosine-uridine preferring nucleoside hydrolase